MKKILIPFTFIFIFVIASVALADKGSSGEGSSSSGRGSFFLNLSNSNHDSTNDQDEDEGKDDNNSDHQNDSDDDDGPSHDVNDDSSNDDKRGRSFFDIFGKNETKVEFKTKFGDDNNKSDLSPLERMRARALTEIDRRIESLKRLKDRIDATKHISVDAKADLKANIDDQIDVLAVLKIKIQGDTDEATLKADIQSITKSYRIYMLVVPQSTIIAHAERISAVADLMSDFAAKLKTRIDAADDAGIDTTAVEASYDSMLSHIVDAKADAKAAIDLVVKLDPDNGSEATMNANNKALQDARSKLKSAKEELQGARKDAQSIVVALKLKGEVKLEHKNENKNDDN